MPQYGSKFKAFRVNIRPEVQRMHPTMPIVVDTIPAMVAEFGVHDGEYEYRDPHTGLVEKHAHIRGNFYDLDADAAAKGWTGEEYRAAQKRLDDLCESWPEAIWKLEPAAPAVPVAPWPTYDSTDPKKVAALAVELGLVTEALAYEVSTQSRKAVVKQLQEVGTTEEALTAA